MIKWFFNIAGTLALVFAIAGIFLPLLPTTPFVLLASACYLRGSARLHRCLVQHPVLGPYLVAFQAGHGIPARAKIMALITLWVSMAISAWIIPIPWVRWLLLVPGIGVTAYLLRMKTCTQPRGEGTQSR